MCQLNVYVFSKETPELKIKQIFNKNHIKVFENISNDIKTNKYHDCNYYHTAPNKCNCGSIFCLLMDYKEKYGSYAEFLSATGKDNITKLYNIKACLLDDYYNAKLSKAITYKNKLFNQLNRLRKPIDDLEVQLFDGKKQSVDEWEQNNATLLVAREKLEKSDEYQMLNTAYSDFVARNETLISSANYTLDTADTGLINIDSAIIKAESDSHIKTNLEFITLYKIYREVLDETDKIIVFPFWQDDDYSDPAYFDDLDDSKVIKMDDLKLEDFIFLNYKQALVITK